MDSVSILGHQPGARAVVRGGTVTGEVRFFQTDRGVLVRAEMFGLPHSGEVCRSGVFAFHIHIGRCAADHPDDPSAHVEGHYNPHNCLHPYHAGDLPPLFASQDGYAFQTVLTDRFALQEILGKTVVVHARRDDFTTQPSGDPGIMIACGDIRPM